MYSQESKNKTRRFTLYMYSQEPKNKTRRFTLFIYSQEPKNKTRRKTSKITNNFLNFVKDNIVGFLF